MFIPQSDELLSKVQELEQMLKKERELNKHLESKMKLLRNSKAFRLAHHYRLARADWKYIFNFPGIGMRFLMRNWLLMRGNQKKQLTLLDAQHKQIPAGLEQQSVVAKQSVTKALTRYLKAFDAEKLNSVEVWLNKNPDALNSSVIIYADMNLNVVDGSSIWFANVVSMMAETAKCIIITKAPITRNIITDNFKNKHNITILNHQDVFPLKGALQIKDAIELIRLLDNLMPYLARVIVRGLDGAYELLATRQFYNRAAIYLTNFYETNEFGRYIPEEVMPKLCLCLKQAAYVLVQTPYLESELRNNTGINFRSILLPPAIPDDLPKIKHKNKSYQVKRKIKIGYAGKINSEWGVLELLDWVDELRSTGVKVELHIVADSIRNGPDPEYFNLKETIKPRLVARDVYHYIGKNRQESMDVMSSMDFVWCYRPSRLEDNTLELSTKLIEMVAMGARCICRPNSINVGLLGEDYQYFIRDFESLKSVILSSKWGEVSQSTIQNVRDNHSLAYVGKALKEKLLNFDEIISSKQIVFAGNDFKFIDAYISDLKSRAYNVVRDQWEWGEPSDIERSKRQLKQADVIFCEWGLANAAWYSKNITFDKKLLVRIHAQEIRERAKRFSQLIKLSNVTKFIYIADHIREKSISMNNWPKEVTELIPNYLFDEEFNLPLKKEKNTLHLAMVGMVPQLKRFDRAVSLLKTLLANGKDAYLHIKGQRPENLPFMLAPGRAAEMAWFNNVYAQINEDSALKDRIIFEPWGNDVAQWLQSMDVILSCSDSEGSHQALAEGVLSGCYPVIWPWEGASSVYKPDWVINNEIEAVSRIVEYQAWSLDKKQNDAEKNRAFIVERYGKNNIFSKLDDSVLN